MSNHPAGPELEEQIAPELAVFIIKRRATLWHGSRCSEPDQEGDVDVVSGPHQFPVLVPVEVSIVIYVKVQLLAVGGVTEILSCRGGFEDETANGDVGDLRLL